MRHALPGQTAGCLSCWVSLVICLAVVLPGCGKKEIPLSKAAQACKENLLKEMAILTRTLAEPVARQDWSAAQSVLQDSYERIVKEGKFVPFRIVALDRYGNNQASFPKAEGRYNFSTYEPAKRVYNQKRKTQALLYLKEKKIFTVIAPLLRQAQVTGAVVMGFWEDELQKWKVSEKEFMGMDFNN